MASNLINIYWIRTCLNNTEKSYIASYCRPFFTNIKIKIIKLIPVMLDRKFGPSTLTKLVLIFRFFILISAETCLEYDAMNIYSRL